MASVSFDLLRLDTEHGPIDLAALATIFATITRDPCARVRAPSAESVERGLDGTRSVPVPNIHTREEGELLVRACTDPPQRVRGLGAGRFALSAAWAATDAVKTDH
jgi:2-keto-3-deoxy-L-rhamnonate aldolase RhmA